MKVFYGMLCFLFALSLTGKAQDSVKVALVQAHLIWGDVKSNLWAFDKRVPLCKGADVIVFPELFTSGCEMKKRDKEEAVRSKDEVASYYPIVIKRMKKWARRSGALVIGSTIYKEKGNIITGYWLFIRMGNTNITTSIIVLKRVVSRPETVI